MPDLIGAKEAAEILGITRRWVLELLKRGDLRGQQINRYWVIDRAEVERYKFLREHGSNGGPSADQQ